MNIHRHTPEIDDLDFTKLSERLGPLHAKQRLGIEIDYVTQLIGQGTDLFNLQNWSSRPSLIEFLLKVSGMYKRGVRNARHVALRRN
jgi:hypothetical protein